MEDLNDFFDIDDFAKTVSYTKQGQSAISIKVIFDKSYFEIDQGQVGIESNQASIDVKSSDIPSIRHEDSFVIDSITYLVRGIHPDGTGLTTLILEKV
ncbi:MAG: hypothetical protein COB02_13765 [Candidatus Cloacimonadota bacterium]|nr:MAG: hypothetical protein COB02_13765 [Candidatus Cloacimonadota bacterium]